MNSEKSVKKVVLVGHCGPDSSYLRIAVRSALGDAAVTTAEDRKGLDRAIEEGVDLVLLNRELDYGYEQTTGVELIRVLKAKFPEMKMMLITNYPEVQAEAVKAGAAPGFGKREIGSPRVKELLRGAMGL